MIQINEGLRTHLAKSSSPSSSMAIRCLMAGLLTALTAGCQAWISQVPIAPFQSDGAPAADLSHGSAALDRGLTGEPAFKAPSQNVDSSNSTSGAVSPKASVFLIKWSLPASSVSINEFKLDFGENPKALSNSVKLKRSDLESTYSANNTELIFQHKVSVPGEIESLSVKVSALSSSGQLTESNVFTSKRLVDSPT